MQGHRLLRTVAVLILIVAFAYLVLALGGSLWLGGSGFGSGWGTGWTGWLVVPLAAAAVMAGLTLMVFGLMLFFLAKIDDNLAVARQRPRVRVKAKGAPVAAPALAAAAAVAPAMFAPPVQAAEPTDFQPAPDVVVSATALPPAAPDRVEPPAVAAPADESMPRMVFGEQAGEVAVLGGVLPSVEITEDRVPAEETPVEVERTAEVAAAEAAPPDLILREPVQIEVEAGEPEIGLPSVDVTEAEPAVPEEALPASTVSEVELPRVDLSAAGSQLETEGMATPGRLPPAEAPAPAASSSQPILETLQAQLAALQAQLAALQAQMGQPGTAPAPAGSTPAARPAPDRAEMGDVAEEGPAGESPASGRLPGADEVARIAAEMNALKPKPDRPAPAASPSPSTTMRAPQLGNAAGGDNLEIIMGVGPIYAKRLREVGITTYAQLAEASYEVLEKVARGNLERVIKEDWRGQARRLMNRS